MANTAKISHVIGYGIYLGLTAVARLLPLRVVFLIGRELGRVGFFLLPGRRRLAIDNIRLALGKTHDQARELALEHFMNLGANMLSATKIATMSEKAIFQHVTTEIPAELEKVARGETDEKPGWVAMISHMGNWELFSHVTSVAPHYKFGGVYHKLANDYVDRHFRESRAKRGVTLFDRREGYLKCVAFIKEGGGVGVLVDQYAGVPGTWMPFFRRITSTSTLAATLALRAGADVLPISVMTTGIARWHLKVSRPIPRDPDLEGLTYRINQVLEEQIKESPADWLWSHDRWKTPKWGSLFTRNGRRLYYPPGFDKSTLIPYRIVVRSVDDVEEAKVSQEAMIAIKDGRPDAHLTVIAGREAAAFWKTVPQVDEVLVVQPGDTPEDVGHKIRERERFEIGVLFSPERDAALELYYGKVPYRYGPPYRRGLTTWENPPGKLIPPDRGPERYRRIAQQMGALMFPLD